MRQKQKGAVSVLVIVTVLFIIILLTTAFNKSTGKRREQLQSDVKLMRKYKEDVDNVDNVYNELIASGRYTDE